MYESKLDLFEKSVYEKLDMINIDIESTKKKNSERFVKIKKDLWEAINKNKDGI
jgi:predicted lipid-binding transport protein (Tim44 family)